MDNFKHIKLLPAMSPVKTTGMMNFIQTDQAIEVAEVYGNAGVSSDELAAELAFRFNAYDDMVELLKRIRNMCIYDSETKRLTQKMLNDLKDNRKKLTHHLNDSQD